MNDRPQHFGDHPDDHDVLVRLVERVANYMESNSATLRSIADKGDEALRISGEALEIAKATERNVAIQNGGVKTALARLDTHDQHHGKGDIHIAERLTGLDVAEGLKGHDGRITALETPAHDADVRHKQDRERVALVMAGAAAVPVLYGAYEALMAVFG